MRKLERLDRGTSPPGEQRSAEERLRELNAIRDEGLLRPDEYEAKRREILDDL